MKMKKQAPRGFTIIEILMALSLAAILTTVAVSQYTDFTHEARTAVTQDRMKELVAAIIGDPRFVSQTGEYTKPGFEIQVGSLPASLTELTTQGTHATYDPFTKVGWRGPYVRTVQSDWNQDAWGTALQYNSSARTLTSYGPDTASGGGDDITLTF